MNYKVQEIRLRRQCFPFEHVESEPSVVCPLCAVEKHDALSRTAVYLKSGYIKCHACGRVSAIVTVDGLSVIPGSLSVLNVRRLLNELSQLRSALSGNGELLDLLVEEKHPAEEAPFNLYRIVLEGGAAAGEQELDPDQEAAQPFSPAAAARIKSLEDAPLALRRLLGIGNVPVEV